MGFDGVSRAVTYIKHKHAFTRFIFSFPLQVDAHCLQLSD